MKTVVESHFCSVKHGRLEGRLWVRPCELAEAELGYMFAKVRQQTMPEMKVSQKWPAELPTAEDTWKKSKLTTMPPSFGHLFHICMHLRMMQTPAWRSNHATFSLRMFHFPQRAHLRTHVSGSATDGEPTLRNSTDLNKAYKNESSTVRSPPSSSHLFHVSTCLTMMQTPGWRSHHSTFSLKMSLFLLHRCVLPASAGHRRHVHKH